MLLYKPIKTINLSHLKRRLSQKYCSYYLTVFENGTTNNDYVRYWLKTYFDDFYILNSILIFWSFDQLKMFTYSPFEERLYRIASINPAILFPNKISNMHGYPLKIFRFDDLPNTYRPDLMIMHEILQQINASATIIVPSDNETYGYMLPNGSAVGVLGKIIKHEVDLSMNLRYLRPPFYQQQLAELFVLDRDDICIFIPAATNKSKKILLDVIDPFYVLCSFSFLIIVSIIQRIMVNLYPKSIQDNNFSWFHIVQVYLNFTTPIFPKQEAQKILIIFWLIFCMIQSIVFSSFILSSLVHTTNLNEINNLEELGASNMTTITVNNLAFVIKISINGTPMQNRFMNNLYDIDHKLFIHLLNETRPTQAIGASRYSPFFFQFKALKDNRRLVYYKMGTSAVPFLCGYIVPYGSPYPKEFGKIVQYLREGGFLNKWLKDDPTNINENQPVPMAMDNLHAFFWLLLIGYVMALSVFCVELILAYYNNNRNLTLKYPLDH